MIVTEPDGSKWVPLEEYESLSLLRDDLELRAREVTCVWCGYQFGSTLQSQAEHLYEHAKVCDKHPVRKAEAERDAAVEVAHWAQAVLTAWNVAETMPNGCPLHLKLREVMIAYRAALEPKGV